MDGLVNIFAINYNNNAEGEEGKGLIPIGSGLVVSLYQINSIFLLANNLYNAWKNASANFYTFFELF